MHVLQPNSAGIDVGATEIYVAVPDDRSSKPVRRFDTFTDDLHETAKWLKECDIESIAMRIYRRILDSDFSDSGYLWF